MRQIRMLLSWCMALFLLGIFVHFLTYPWIGATEGAGFLRDAAGENQLFADLADFTGLENIEPMGRYVFAGFGVVSALCLLISPLRKGGAWLAVIFFGVHAIALALPVFLAQKGLSPSEFGQETDALLYLDLTSITAAFLLLVVHPAKRV